jgi:predicted aminopeptidase
VVAVVHTIVTLIYHLLRHRTVYCELDSQYFDERDRRATEQRQVRRLAA